MNIQRIYKGSQGHQAEESHATDEVVGWFRARGWIAAAFRDDLIAAPLVAAEVPDSCFHVTPASNRDGILARGLMRGAEAGVSTTGRADAACRIHVSFDPDAATRWAEEHLAPHNPSGLWVLFRVSRAGIAGPVYRDPASHTGYIIEGGRVAPEALRVEREWAVEGGTSSPGSAQS